MFSKKLKVQVDFGDTPEQINKGNEYSEYLTNKKSYAAVLNYMVEKQFELVNTLELTESYQGSGGTTGIVFIMKKKEWDNEINQKTSFLECFPNSHAISRDIAFYRIATFDYNIMS